MDEAEKVFRAALPADHQAAEVMRPGEQALDFPAPPVTPQWPPVLARLAAIGAVGGDKLNAIFQQRLVQPVAVIGLIANQPLGRLRHEPSFQRAPLRNTQTIPSGASLLSRHGRPRPSARRGGSGINSRTARHCSCVSSTASPPPPPLPHPRPKYPIIPLKSIYETASSKFFAILCHDRSRIGGFRFSQLSHQKTADPKEKIACQAVRDWMRNYREYRSVADRC